MDAFSNISLCVFKRSHAIPQMEQRGITFQQVEQVLCYPYNIVRHVNIANRWVYHEGPNNQGLKVIVDLNYFVSPQIVTTFRPCVI